MLKYIVIFLSAFTLEIVTTFYINGVAEKNVLQTLFFAFISPFVSLPFVVYIIESKTMLDRAKMACFSGTGYAVGVYVVMLFINGN